MIIFDALSVYYIPSIPSKWYLTVPTFRLIEPNRNFQTMKEAVLLYVQLATRAQKY